MDHCVDCNLWDRTSPWAGKCSEWATTKGGPPFVIVRKAGSGYDAGENILTLKQFGCPAWEEKKKSFTVHGDTLRYNRAGKPVTSFSLYREDVHELAQAICRWLNSLWPESDDDD